MNKIKLLSLLIAAATSIAALADGGTWNFSGSNGTLTINASGDLTTASQSTTYKVFTSAAVENVFTDNTGTNVIAGNTYNAGTTYYEAVSSWTQLFTSNNNVPTTEGNYAYSISETYKWKESTAGANDKYIYSAYLGNEERSNLQYNIPENTYFYEFNLPSEIWKSSALANGTKMYCVTYSNRQWNTSNTSGKYIYKVTYNSSGSYEIGRWDNPVNENGGLPEDYVTIYSSGTSYNTWDNIYMYIYTTSKLTWEPNDYNAKTVTIGDGEGDAKYVTDDMVSNTPVLTIGSQVNLGSSENESTYTDPGTFTYNGSTYYRVVTATSDQTTGTTITLPLGNESNVSLVSDISSYHEQSSKVYITKKQNSDPCNNTLDVNTKFTYNGTQYLKYATASTDLSNGTVSLSSLNLFEATEENKTTVSGYVTYTSKYPISSNGWSARYTNQDYTAQNAITYNGTQYAGYVILSSAYDSSKTYYVGDEGVTLITEADLQSTYLDGTITYYANNNLYRSTDNGTTKTLLTAWQQYTYSTGDTFYTPAATEYVAITNNAEYFGTGGTGESYITDQTETLTFKEALRLQILSGSYTKVVFDNTASGELTINSDIVHAILYPNIASQEANGTIEELDMGKATMISLNSVDMSAYVSGSVSRFEDFLMYPDMSYVTPENLEKVTLPLVRKNDEEMVLPSLDAKIPSSVKTVTVPDGYTKVGEAAFLGCYAVTHVNLPEKLTEIGDYSFYICNALAEINITDAEVANRKIVFPSTVQTIGESAFKDDKKLVSTKADPFILPESLVTIEACAFANLTELLYLELNKSLEFVGNSAFFCSSALKEQTTITFPKSIKYLGPGSFLNRWYSDIYFTGTTAPISPLGNCDSRVNSDGQTNDQTAFSGNIQYGYNGFNPYLIEGSSADNAFQNGYANRENYMNNDAYYFTMLHFPDSLTTDQLNTYRAADRVYITANVNDGVYQYKGYGSTLTGEEGYPMTASHFKESDATNLTYQGPHGGARWPDIGVLTAKTVNPGYVDTYQGLQRIWPSQAQWMRYFALAANGYQWDGTTPYQPTVTDDMLELMEKDGLKVYNVTETYGSANADNDVAITKSVWSSLSSKQQEYLSKILYQGTRRFVLSYDGGYDIPFKVKLKGGRWWSICLPFNMTKAEVDHVFGGDNTGTHVCLMSAVDRSVTNNSTDGNTLVLKFKNDVYRHRTVRTTSKSTTTNEEKEGSGLVYTYASNFSKSSAAPADDDIVIYARESYMIYPVRQDVGTDPVYYDFGSPVFETGDPLPTIVYSNSDAPYTTQHESDPAYRFIGNFTTSTGNDNQGKAVTIKIPQYSYAYGRASASDTKSKFFILSTAGATWSPFKSLVQNTAVDGGLNDWNNFFQQNAARVNQVSLFGDDEEVTGIDNVIIEVSSDNDEDLRVFNLNGSMMGNSLQGLPAGTYIQGGKAYRVK